VNQIVLFSRSGRPASDALLSGARIAGIRVVQQRPIFNPRDGLIANVAAVFVDGLRGDCRAVRDAYRAAGVPVYVIDLPRLRAATGDDDSVAVGLYLYTHAFLSQRMANRAVVHGVIADRLERDVLVCGQKPDDAQHGMDLAGVTAWATETIARCRALFPDRVIVYRPHPKAQRVDHEALYGADAVSIPGQTTLREALATAAVLVTHNSTAGVEAIDAGVPVLYTASPDTVCYAEYAIELKNFERLGDGSLPAFDPAARETFLARCAASDWTIEQLRDGTFLRCLFLGQPYPESVFVHLAPTPIAPAIADAETPETPAVVTIADELKVEAPPAVEKEPAPKVQDPPQNPPEIEMPPVSQLADVLARITDGNIVLEMQARDARKTAQPLYEARLTELTAPGT
jgi:hypothetical protein